MAGSKIGNELMSEGALQYDVGVHPCCGRGYAHSEAETSEYLAGRVARAHCSIDEFEELEAALQDLAVTAFEQENLRATLQTDVGTEAWRLGETVAECWLEDRRDCLFPWKTQHDLRSLKGSLPGADLVGLAGNGDNTCFAFGEVKTSSDKNTPPGVIYGQKGLTFQLRHLKLSERQRRQIIRNLGHRAHRSSWFPRYRGAVSAHLKGRYRYWGVLVRDTEPSEADVTSSVNNLAEHSSDETPVEIVALYVGVPIPEWGNHCVTEPKP